MIYCERRIQLLVSSFLDCRHFMLHLSVSIDITMCTSHPDDEFWASPDLILASYLYRLDGCVLDACIIKRAIINHDHLQRLQHCTRI